MQPPNSHSWIDLTELKSLIVKKLGPERAKQYFDYLNKFLSLKLSKVDFDKVCIRTIGRDGIPLHNQLIRSILSNATCTKKVVQVPVSNKKPIKGSTPIITQVSNPLTFQNGDILSPTRRKPRTGTRERRGGDLRITVKGKSGPIPLHAPLGIPYCPVSIGGARKAPPIKSVGVSDTNGLLETVKLKKRMDLVAETHGLETVSMDSANTLNNGLDAYLKGLIKSCCELNEGRSGYELIKNSPGHFRHVNSVKPNSSISLLDFRVAMELNHRQLGEDWPVLLERICTHGFEER